MLGLMLLTTAAQAGPRGLVNRNANRPAQRALSAPASDVIFEFLTSAVGAPVLGADLCGQLTADEWVGDTKFCMNADGTFRSGSLEFTPNGGVASSSQRVCPNGLDCDATSLMRFDGVDDDYVTPGNITWDSTTSFSVGCVVSLESAGGVLVSHYGSAGGAAGSWQLYASTSTAAAFLTSNGASSTSTASSTIVSRVHHYIGATFNYVASGAVNSATVYVDGVAGTTSTVMRQPAANATLPIRIGAWADGVASLRAAGAFRGCFLVETPLSAARHAAISAAMLGTLTGKAGEVVTTTRASTSSVTSADGTVLGWVANNRPAVGGGGLQVWPSTTNLVLRSEELDNASWIDSALGAATPTLNGANAGVAPDGTTTAEDYTFPATTGTDYSLRAQSSVCGTSGTRSASVWVKGVTGSGAVDLLVRTTTSPSSTFAKAECAYTSTAWTRCVLENMTMGSGGGNFHVGNATGIGTPATARSSNRVLVWGAQCVAQAIAGPYVATTSAAAARAADTPPTTPSPALLSRTEGSVCMDVTPGWAGTPTVTSGFLSFATSSATVGYANTGGDQFKAYDGTNNPAVTATWVAGTKKRFCTRWSAALNKFRVENVTAGTNTETAFTTLGAFAASLYIGGQGTSDPARGTVGNVVVAKTYGAAQ